MVGEITSFYLFLLFSCGQAFNVEDDRLALKGCFHLHYFNR